jgi:predicted RNase H-like nuclease (RuvC/YqgF family)
VATHINPWLDNEHTIDYVQERGMRMPGIADMVGEIRKLQEENKKLKADLRGKENEINDLKERIAYLKQFKPKEKDIPIRQG